MSRWELTTWVLLGAVPVVMIALASSASDVAVGLALIVLLIATFAWSRKLRRESNIASAPDLPAWPLVAAAVFVGAGVLVFDDLASRLVSALIALSVLAALMDQRRR